MMDWQATANYAIYLTKTYGPEAALAIGLLIAGLMIAHWLGRITDRELTRRQLDPPIRMLLVRLVWLTVMAFTVVEILHNIGFSVVPMIAGLSVVGVGVGLAAQGVLGNLLAGLTIIFTKPFRVGDYIEILGNEGEVITIELTSTILRHTDQSRVVIPNRKIVGEILHNYGHIRQLDLTVNVTHTADLAAVLNVIHQVLGQNPRVVKEMPPVVGVRSVAGPTVLVGIQPWVHVPDFGPAGAEINKALVEQFHAAHIDVPVPTQHVRVLANPA